MRAKGRSKAATVGRTGFATARPATARAATRAVRAGSRAVGLPVTRAVAPGVRLHVLSTDRFTTTYCRVALHRDLGPEAAATAILGQVLQQATARHPTREALAHRLADLYGAALDVSAEKLGDRQVLAASLEWPTSFVPAPSRVLAQGLGILREVLSEPKRCRVGGEEALDPELVKTEQVNHIRSIRALKNDKARYALRRCIEVACEGEPFGLDVEGREEDVPRATPVALAALHRRLLATAPVEVFLVGDLTPSEALAAVRRHLLWDGREGGLLDVPPAGSVRGPRAEPRDLVEREAIVQGKLVLAWRSALPATASLAPAAQTLAGVLGGGPYARLFKVVREVHGLCYYASASWNRAKGLMIVQSGVDPKDAPRARDLIRELEKEVAGGALEPAALNGFREAVAHRVASMQDDRGATVGWFQECLALGTDPSPTRWLSRLERVTADEVREVGAGLGLDTVFLLTSGSAA